MLGLDRELELHRLAAASRHESVQLLAKKLEGGGAGEQPYLKAKAEYEEALAELTVKEAEIAVLEHALSSLLGRNPGRIERGKPLAACTCRRFRTACRPTCWCSGPTCARPSRSWSRPTPGSASPRRSTCRRIGLTAQYGFASAELNKLLQSSSNVSSFGVTLLGPIFTSGRIAGQVREAEAIQQQKAMAYRAERADGAARGRGRARAAPPDLAALGDPHAPARGPAGARRRAP